MSRHPAASYDDIPDAVAALSAEAVVDRIWDTARWKPLVLTSCVLDDRPKVSPKDGSRERSATRPTRS